MDNCAVQKILKKGEKMKKLSYVVTLAAVLIFTGSQIANSQPCPTDKPCPVKVAPCPCKKAGKPCPAKAKVKPCPTKTEAKPCPVIKKVKTAPCPCQKKVNKKVHKENCKHKQ